MSTVASACRDIQSSAMTRPPRFSLSITLLLLALFLGCNGEHRDVSNVAPYSTVIGHTFRVVGAIEALAIRPFGADAPAYIALWAAEPPYSGPEVAFRRPVSRGTLFKIVRADLNDTILDDTYSYVVEFSPPIEPSLPTHLRLRQPFGTADGTLNPQYFERIKSLK